MGSTVGLMSPGPGGIRGDPKPPRLLVDMRKVYRGRLKEGQEGLREVEKALIAQFQNKTGEFLRDLRAMEKEYSERLEKARELRAKAALEGGRESVGDREEGLREMCERLIREGGG